jgi:hypothetical protein
MNPITDLDSGAWADPDFFECPCRGGWLLSNYDTWHRCPFHAEGDGHPDDEFTEEDAKAAEGYYLRMARETFKSYNAQARELGIADFKHKVIDAFFATDADLTRAKRYCIAARSVVTEAAYEARENTARRQGYSCGFEMRMAEEAMWERKERHLYN